MKINYLLLVAATLPQFVDAADRAEVKPWPIADPFAAFAATSAAVQKASVNTRLIPMRSAGPLIQGTPPPFFASFSRRAREPFYDLVCRAADASSMKTADLVAMTMRDRSGVQVCRLDFAPRRAAITNLEIDLHVAMRAPGVAFVPIDIPARYAAHRTLLWAPVFAPGYVLGGEPPPPAPQMEARDALVRDGRIYFPWILVGDDRSAVAVEATLRRKSNGGFWYISSSTTGRDRGRVTVSRQPPAWWPREPRAPTLSERFTR